MENNYGMEQQQEGSVLRGLLGALIGAILGAVIWGAVGLLTQRVFSLIGILLGFLTAKGYELLKGRDGVVKIVIVVICVILSVVLGEAIYNGGMIHQAYLEKVESDIAYYKTFNIDVQAMIETNPTLAYSEYLYTEKEVFEMYLTDKEYLADAGKNLVTALLFAAIGAGAVIVDMAKKKQQTPVAASAAFEPAEQQASEQAESTDSMEA